MKLLFYGIGLFCCLTTKVVLAEEIVASADTGAIPIKGTACEKFNASEAKSTIRVRVTDKACFFAVNSINEVSSFRDGMNEHDYNVLVYGLVDNAIEDMTAKTTKQTDEELCVEVSGYINLDNILQAVAEQDKVSASPDLNNQETMTEIVNDVNNSYSELKNIPATVIPPSDDEIIEKHKAPLSATENLNLPLEAEKTPQATPLTDEASAQNFDDKRGLVYVAPTEFFDKSTSDTHAQILREMFENDNDYLVTDKKDLADYIIKTKVLRAKVDPINSSTNRLQMVVSVEAEFPDEKASAIEHQNRFVLFKSDENEQEVAANLLKKLFAAAGEKIKDKVNQAERRRRPDKALPEIITPTAK